MATLTLDALQQDSESPTLLSILLQQPQELINGVMYCLEYRDLLSLRRVNHKFHNFIHDHEYDMCCRVAAYLQRQQHLLICDQVPQCLPDGYKILRSHTASVDLASLCTRIILKHARFKQRPGESLLSSRRTSDNLNRRLTAGFLLIDYFLDRLSDVMDRGVEELASLSDRTYLRLGSVYELDQQLIIQSFEPLERCVSPECARERILTDSAMAWLILQGVCQAKHLGER